MKKIKDGKSAINIILSMYVYQLNQEMQQELENEEDLEEAEEADNDVEEDNFTEVNPPASTEVTSKLEPRFPEIRLRDSDPQAFEMVLSYIYTDKIDPAQHTSSSMYCLLHVFCTVLGF